MPAALLVNPPSQRLVERRTRKFHRRFPPLSLLITAAQLRNHGWTVRVSDLNADPQASTTALQDQARHSDVVVLCTNPYADWQCPSLDIDHILELSRHLPKERLIITGNHGTHYPGGMLRETGAAVIIRNEPEMITFEVAEAWRTQRGLQDVTGISFRNGESVHHNPTRPLTTMTALPPPAYDLIDLANYHYELLGDRFALLEASRGCPFSCNFCNLSMFQDKYRKQNTEDFLAQADALIEERGCRSLYIFDLEFAINRKMVEAVSQHFIQRDYKRRYGFRWCCQTRADSVDAALLEQMKQSGCTLIHFGVEAGNEGILRQTNKRIRREQIREGVEATRNAGIDSAAFFMFGHPGETVAHYQETLDFALSLNPTYASFHALLPFPGSPLFEQRYGKGPYWDEPLSLKRSYFSPEQEEEISRFIRNAYLRFYMRPRIWPGLAHRHWSDAARLTKLFWQQVWQ
jgi:anaerobic magnesium-protoporphyrin IX monomethyl ester cyclase